MATTDIQEVEMASDGVFLPIQSLATTFGYNADGTVQYMQVTYLGNVYRRTFTYTAGELTNLTEWVKQ